METLLRFFKPNEQTCYEQYKDENLIAPQINAAIALSNDIDNVYRVDDVCYAYDDIENIVTIDVSLRDVESEYWNKYEENSKVDCNGDCEHCELNDAGMTDKKAQL